MEGRKGAGSMEEGARREWRVAGWEGRIAKGEVR